MNDQIQSTTDVSQMLMEYKTRNEQITNLKIEPLHGDIFANMLNNETGDEQSTVKKNKQFYNIFANKTNKDSKMDTMKQKEVKNDEYEQAFTHSKNYLLHAYLVEDSGTSIPYGLDKQLIRITIVDCIVMAIILVLFGIIFYSYRKKLFQLKQEISKFININVTTTSSTDELLCVFKNLMRKKTTL